MACFFSSRTVSSAKHILSIRRHWKKKNSHVSFVPFTLGDVFYRSPKQSDVLGDSTWQPWNKAFCVDPTVTSKKCMKCNSRWALDRKSEVWRDPDVEKTLKSDALESSSVQFLQLVVMAVWNKGALPEQGAKPNSLNFSMFFGTQERWWVALAWFTAGDDIFSL